MTRILLVEDEAHIRRPVRSVIEREGLEVTEAGTGAEALRLAREQPIDVIVLDLGLPDLAGLDLLPELHRAAPGVQVIICSAAASERERVAGLMAGADDYVAKPFSRAELVARVIAAARRRSAPSPTVIEEGDLQLDTGSRRAALGGEPLELTRREFDLLAHLAAHPGQTFGRGELLEAVWSSSSEWQSEATVTEHVRRLRAKIEPDRNRPRHIVTVWGAGYRFDPSPEPTETATEAASAGRAARPGDEAARSPEERVATPPAPNEIDQATVVIVGEGIVDANAAALALLGADRAEQVIGQPYLDFVARHSLGAAVELRRTVQQNSWPRPEIMTVRNLDGRDVVVEVSLVPVSWEGERASQVAMWSLSADTDRLREVITGIRTDVTEAVLVCDGSLRILSFNAAAEALTGWTEDEVLGRHCVDVLRPGGDFDLDEVLAAFAREGRWNGEILTHHRDGSPVLLRTTSTSLCGTAGELVGAISVSRPVEHGRSPDPPPGRSGSLADVAGLGAVDGEIRRAFDERQFVVHYQPIIRFADGVCAGVEALVRWEHPDRGLLAPGEFLGLVDDAGATDELAQVVLEEATGQWARWRDDGFDLRMSVNVSGRELADPALPDRIGAAMNAEDMPAGALWLEVTETTLVEDVDQATAMLTQVVDRGARIAIDDFGTGWASLTYLSQFPVHALKVDRSFVFLLGQEPAASAIVSSVIGLGLALDLTVIAEGIETMGQLEHLERLGCDLGQGFLFARPQPAEATDLHDRQSPWRLRAGSR